MGLMLCMGKFGGCRTAFRRDLRVEEERWMLGYVRAGSICSILLMNAERARNCHYFFEIKNLRESEMSGVGSRKETRGVSYHNSRKGDKKDCISLRLFPGHLSFRFLNPTIVSRSLSRHVSPISKQNILTHDTIAYARRVSMYVSVCPGSAM